MGDELKKLGFEVISLDKDPKGGADHTIDVLDWDFQSAYPVGYFDLITASPPCCEFSLALTTRPRELDESDRIVRRTLLLINHFQPKAWWIENPRFGLLCKRPCMDGIPYTDVDYCQFADWGYQKPTRIWGSRQVQNIPPVLCDGRTCKNLVPTSGGNENPEMQSSGRHR